MTPNVRIGTHCGQHERCIFFRGGCCREYAAKANVQAGIAQVLMAAGTATFSRLFPSNQKSRRRPSWSLTSEV